MWLHVYDDDDNNNNRTNDDDDDAVGDDKEKRDYECEREKGRAGDSAMVWQKSNRNKSVRNY